MGFITSIPPKILRLETLIPSLFVNPEMSLKKILLHHITKAANKAIAGSSSKPWHCSAFIFVSQEHSKALPGP